MAASINPYTPTAIYKVTIKATGKTFYAAPSGADDGSCYRIEHHPGHYSCTCPDATYRNRACRHLQVFVAYLKEKRQAVTRAASAPCADMQGDAPWGDYQAARMDAAVYVPVAARYQADSYGDYDDYCPSDYRSHEYRQTVEKTAPALDTFTIQCGQAHRKDTLSMHAQSNTRPRKLPLAPRQALLAEVRDAYARSSPPPGGTAQHPAFCPLCSRCVPFLSF